MREVNLNISDVVVSTYHGEMINSLDGTVYDITVTIEVLREKIIKVAFKLGNLDIAFRALLTPSEEDIVMIIQEKVTENYILRGLDGFLYNKPRAHGGYVDLLNGLFFNIGISHYCGQFQEFYFFGKPVNKNNKAKGLSLC